MGDFIYLIKKTRFLFLVKPETDPPKNKNKLDLKVYDWALSESLSVQSPNHFSS